jgi:hypothetical protein
MSKSKKIKMDHRYLAFKKLKKKIKIWQIFYYLFYIYLNPELLFHF